MNKLKERLDQLSQKSSAKPTIPANYEDLPDLTDEELTEAVLNAKKAKFSKIESAKYLSDLNRARVFRTYSAEELFKFIQHTKFASGKSFVIDDLNGSQIRQLCLYFSNDSRFDGDLEKGLLLNGSLGQGKTHLMECFVQNQKASYSVVSARQISAAWKSETVDQNPKVLDYYSTNRKLAFNENRFGHLIAGLCIDEIGVEEAPTIRFGERKNVIEELLLNRYELVTKWKPNSDDQNGDNRPRFCHTHITTNLNPDQLETHLGSRVRDRLREMVNVITFTGPSRR